MENKTELPRGNSNLDVRIIGSVSVVIGAVAYIAELNLVAPIVMFLIGIAGIIPIPQVYGKKR